MRLIDDLWNFLLFKFYKVRNGNNFLCEGRLVVQGRGGIL